MVPMVPDFLGETIPTFFPAHFQAF